MPKSDKPDRPAMSLPRRSMFAVNKKAAGIEEVPEPAPIVAPKPKTAETYAKRFDRQWRKFEAAEPEAAAKIKADHDVVIGLRLAPELVTRLDLYRKLLNRQQAIRALLFEHLP